MDISSIGTEFSTAFQDVNTPVGFCGRAHGLKVNQLNQELESGIENKIVGSISQNFNQTNGSPTFL